MSLRISEVSFPSAVLFPSHPIRPRCPSTAREVHAVATWTLRAKHSWFGRSGRKCSQEGPDDGPFLWEQINTVY